MSVAPGKTEPALLERTRELAALDAAVDAVATGPGRPVVIEGPAGIGKTRLLTALHEQARARWFEVLVARGGEFERDHPFGLARQLFGPILAGASAEARDRLLDGVPPQAIAAAQGAVLGSA